MIDFSHVEQYRENNRIEAKKALGGLPRSIWETYSAFANTLGGIILLGVEEYSDHSLHPVDLPDPEGMIREFWEIVAKGRKVSANILSERDVTVETVNGKRIIAIRVPRAGRCDKPVFIDGDPMTGSYRRNGEGDYRCPKEEIEAMLRDATVQTQDMRVLKELGVDTLCEKSIRAYRTRLLECRGASVWQELDGTEFLRRVGAVGQGDDGVSHPTAAGLLMFGSASEIVKIYPAYHLEYQEKLDPVGAHRILSSSGDWSGNLYDFYMRVSQRITEDAERFPQNAAEIGRVLREALANCLINADYRGARGIVVVKTAREITFSNPGSFRVDPKAAMLGGVSDPRNRALIKMFSMIDVGKGMGSGISNMFGVWKKQGWSAPVITERFDPDRITLSLTLGKDGDGAGTIQAVAHRQAILSYLTERVTAKGGEIADLIGINPTKATDLLEQMVREQLLTAEGSDENRSYRLKA